MKIKRKRLLNLHELIKWAWENKASGSYTATTDDKVKVEVTWGIDTTYGGRIPTHFHRFEIEEEIEITRNTKLDLVVETYVSKSGRIYAIARERESIEEILNSSVLTKGTKPRTLHYVHEDGNMTLIWQNENK